MIRQNIPINENSTDLSRSRNGYSDASSASIIRNWPPCCRNAGAAFRSDDDGDRHPRPRISSTPFQFDLGSLFLTLPPVDGSAARAWIGLLRSASGVAAGSGTTVQDGFNRGNRSRTGLLQSDV